MGDDKPRLQRVVFRIRVVSVRVGKLRVKGPNYSNVCFPDTDPEEPRFLSGGMIGGTNALRTR